MLNTIVAEAIDALSAQLEKQLKAAKGDLGAAVSAVVKDVWEANKQIVFDGDNYSDEWHAEAEKRGLQEPAHHARRAAVAHRQADGQRVRELQACSPSASSRRATRWRSSSTRPSSTSRRETAASIARTMILPAAARHLARAARPPASRRRSPSPSGLLDELWTAIGKLEEANLADNQPDEEPLKWSKYMRDKVIPAMDAVRDVADRLERIVADDLWPLPKYSEMLFIK